MTNIVVTNFASGEVTPEADARKDIDKYTGGCRTLENMIPDLYGNATRRPGTELIVVGNGFACYYPPVVPDPAKTQISTPQQLQDIGSSQAALADDYELINNIDMTGFDWTPIGISFIASPADNFNGTLDGNFFTISNLTMSSPASPNDYALGLFNNTHSCTIENLVLENITIDMANTSIAGLLIANGSHSPVSGRLSTIVTQVRASGTIIKPSGAPDVVLAIGGLVGTSNAGSVGATAGRGIFTRCSSNVAILSDSTNDLNQGGGLLGSGGGALITDCYAEGSINASAGDLDEGGGLVGFSQNIVALLRTIITNCYSALTLSSFDPLNSTIGGFWGKDTDFLGGGIFATFTDNFWDNDVAPTGYNDIGDLGDVANVTKKTTGLMFQEATFTNWDFTADTGVWKIDEGNDYPRHQWNVLSDIKEVCQPL